MGDTGSIFVKIVSAVERRKKRGNNQHGKQSVVWYSEITSTVERQAFPAGAPTGRSPDGHLQMRDSTDRQHLSVESA